MKTASWVIRDKKTKQVVLETFNPGVVSKLNTSRYEAIPILEYLQELNRSVKKEHSAMKQNPVARALATLKAAEARGLRKNPGKRLTHKYANRTIKRKDVGKSYRGKRITKTDIGRVRKVPARFHVQAKRGTQWQTLGEFRIKAAAIEYAKAIHRAHPKATLRVFG